MSKNSPISLSGAGAVLNGLPQPVLIIDWSRYIVFSNKAATAFFDSDLTGQLVHAALRQPEALRCIDEAQNSLRSTHGRVTLSTNDIDTAFRMNAVPIDSNGEEHGVIVISLTDVSRVDEAEEIRRQFVANVSHELKTPLTTLTGFIETLKKLNADERETRMRFLEIMQEEAERMNRLIEDLLSLSRVESLERVRPKIVVDLAEVLKSSVRQLNFMSDEQNTDISLCAEDIDMRVFGDQDQLAQVFFNLLENALKYGGQGGVVHVSCCSHADFDDFAGPAVSIAITDEGEGIEAVHLPRLTERFYRVDGHRSREVGGTGLGLAIVKHIVHRHRGRLKIKSELGMGSEFTVTLPAIGKDEPHERIDYTRLS